MKIAVISEVSAGDKNSFIVNALAKTENEIFNVGMETGEGYPVLTYIHTGLMAGILLNLGAVDFVIGGCGTGEGFLISAMQYPNVFCGLITEPLDAFLFGQINGGNCISLALNKGFGWAGDVNLEYVFEKLMSAEFGKGYPESRKASQQASRRTLMGISKATHKSFIEILSTIDKELVETAMKSVRFKQAILGECKDKVLQQYIIKEFIK
ncbi:MAG: RpiB/LacA/LacB family sugar-phosphate isomerase [Clostridia bacterium]|nr:RpiB/LacA/LacB family sugar-phosphate isomerase [Clostridia bacterium]